MIARYFNRSDEHFFWLMQDRAARARALQKLQKGRVLITIVSVLLVSLLAFGVLFFPTQSDDTGSIATIMAMLAMMLLQGLQFDNQIKLLKLGARLIREKPKQER